MQPTLEHIVFIDGDCILCNRAVIYLDSLDTGSILHYAHLQSITASRTIPTQYIQDKNTLVYKTGDRVYTKSEAILKILETINGLRFLQIVMRYTPKAIANFIYDLIAKSRLAISSNMTMCKLNEDLNSRMIK
jgi:predicted DCC family thiol-disulfide oxidoreductase YuxK